VNKTLVLALSGLALIAGATNAAAQDPAAISDADIKAYATVAAKVSKIQADAKLSDADRNAQMAAAVKESGMDTEKFNAITSASKTDPEVRRKLQEAMTK
jgi:hypothetical protein